MNRLVIIGNGFDLAHGLPTSYKDFLNDFWRNLTLNIENGIYEKLLIVDKNHINMFDQNESNFESFLDVEKSVIKYSNIQGFYFDTENKELRPSNSHVKLFSFKNGFFKRINLKNSKNWVDIENEYYQQLKKIVKENDDVDKRKKEVKKLHEEFDDVKRLLEMYLDKNVNEIFLEPHLNNFKLNHKLYEHFNIGFISGSELINNMSEFPKDDEEGILQVNSLIKGCSFGEDVKKVLRENNITITNLFLNFNYTNTIDKYNFSDNYNFYGESKFINIHGELNSTDNKMIFGFGDEMDDNYSTIEKLDDNEFLKNFKSFQYSLNHSYKMLLDFIESNKFQVYIMGHSCGLSDRILLNTIFEHENCRSIKIFYRQKEDGTDNYTNLVQNISRHFNDKALMRKKLVNKLLCKALPQVKQNV